MHRYTLGGTLGGALIKDKLFGFVSYQHLHDSDQEIGLSRMLVPVGLSNDRSPAALATISNNFWGTSLTGNGDLNPTAVALFQYKLPNGLVPDPAWDGQTATPIPETRLAPGTAYFTADQAVTNLDWNKSSTDTVSVKSIISTIPFRSLRLNVAGTLSDSMPAARSIHHQHADDQVESRASPRFSAFSGKVYSTIAQPFSPQSFAAQTGTPAINTFGSSFFPGITIVDPLITYSRQHGRHRESPILTIGQVRLSRAFGVFQNRIMPSANAIWNQEVYRHLRRSLLTPNSYRELRTNRALFLLWFLQFIQGAR